MKSRNRTSNDKLRKSILNSLVLHVGLLTFGALVAVFFSPQAQVYLPTLHVDIVALPNKVKDEKSSLDTRLPVKEDPFEKPKEVEKKQDDFAFEKEKKKPSKRAKSILEELREEMRRKKILEEERKRAEDEKEAEKFRNKFRNAVRGNQRNQGTNITGTMEASLNAYAGHVSEVLRSNWGLPAWLQSQNLRATVRIFIGSSGQIIRYNFQRSSGNEMFDEYVKTAIDRSETFSPPPPEMARDLQVAGIDVLFPL